MMTSLVSFQFLLMDQVNNLYFNHLLAALVYVLAGLLDVHYPLYFGDSPRSFLTGNDDVSER